MKVSIIGLGRVGSTLVYSLTPNPSIDELFIYDVIEKKMQGVMLDVSHAYPEFSYKLKTGEPSQTKKSKIIIIAAGIPRDTKIKSRIDLLEDNKKIMQRILEDIKWDGNTIILVLTNPVEPLTYLAYKNSKLNEKKVIGLSNYLDSQRLKYLISKRIGASAKDIEGFVIGEHGEDMIPIFSSCKVNKNPIELKKSEREGIENELKAASKEIIALSGGTQFGPAETTVRVVDSIINDSKEIFPLSFFANSEYYNVENVCISLPVKVGISGIEEIVHINLNEDERKRLKNLEVKLKKIQEKL